MRSLLRWYGASPLHLLAMLACFGLAGYAAIRLVSSGPLAVIVWFLGAVIGHDLLLVPLYSLADRSVLAVIRHRAPPLPVTLWINYLRVPAALSGLLLLVWFPLILRLPSPYQSSTTLSADPYVWHWLAVTGTLFLLSAVAFAIRLRRRPRPTPPRAATQDTSPGPAAPSTASPPAPAAPPTASAPAAPRVAAPPAPAEPRTPAPPAPAEPRTTPPPAPAEPRTTPPPAPAEPRIAPPPAPAAPPAPPDAPSSAPGSAPETDPALPGEDPGDDPKAE